MRGGGWGAEGPLCRSELQTCAFCPSAHQPRPLSNDACPPPREAGSSGHTWHPQEAVHLVCTETSGPEHMEGWEGPGLKAASFPGQDAPSYQEVPAGWGVVCGQDEGLKAEGTRERRCVHTCRRRNPHSLFTLRPDLPSAPARTRRGRVDAAFKTTPGPAHRHTWSRSQTHLVPLTGAPGPAHRRTWSRSQAHLILLTDTPGLDHRHTWSRSQTHLVPLRGKHMQNTL